ncbi:MAG: hypothetical protein AB1671_25730 [Thermodesulfobacteriota bacterium]|jgi:hypothetical protein
MEVIAVDEIGGLAQLQQLACTREVKVFVALPSLRDASRLADPAQ